MCKSKTDLYNEITDKIIKKLEEGTKPWFKPWSAEHAYGKISIPLRYNFKPYKGINILNLWMCAEDKGYSTPIWMTFKQAKDLGGWVRKDEKASLSVKGKTYTKIEQNKEGEDVKNTISFLKRYNVYNVEQIDNLPEKYYNLEKEPELTPEVRIEKLEKFFANTGAEIKEGGNRAYYSITHNYIQMPPFVAFKTPDLFYSTLGHESVHWTRHHTRLDRDFGRKRWGDEGYAMEELVAELGSAYLSAGLGLETNAHDENAAYIESWIAVLKEDKRAIFTAAAHAQKAVELLYEYQEKAEEAA